MSVLKINASEEVPEIYLDSNASVMNFSGIATPKDVFGLYQQISEWIDTYKKQFGNELKCTFNFKYMNTESRKMIFEVLKKVIKVTNEQNKKLSIFWISKDKDEDILELGKEYEDILEIPFTFQS